MIKPMNLIKKVLPKSLKFKSYLYFGEDYSKDYNLITKPKVFVMLAGDYGNLGDIAITEAQIEFIGRTLPQYIVIPVEINKTYRMIKTIKKIIQPNDVITIIGGGNMGDRYEGFENLRRNIIRTFPKNKIVSFPQTIDFSDTKNGEKRFTDTRKSYSSHTNLHLFARESISYQIMEDSFKDNFVNLVPDIVLSLKVPVNNQNKRDGIIFCLREDSEINIESNIKDSMINEITNNYSRVSFLDTHIRIDNEQYLYFKEAFRDLLKEFSNSELVITDRLHGMIFSVITGTPCIVLPNINHKIIGTYNDWLKNLDYINLIENINDIDIFLKEVEKMLKIDTNRIEIFDFSKQYKSLELALLQ